MSGWPTTLLLPCRRMPLAELQRRLGLADPTAHLQPRSNGIKAELETEQLAGAEADQLAGENGAAGPPPDGGTTDATAPQPGDSTVAADTPPGDPGAAPTSIEAAADPAATPSYAVAAEPQNPEPDAGVAPVHELYEALLRVLLQVPSTGTLESRTILLTTFFG